jgi:sulfatase modifying factor 1
MTQYTRGAVLAIAAVLALGSRPLWAEEKGLFVTAEEPPNFVVHFPETSPSLRLIWINGGTFRMGTPLGEVGRREEEIAPTTVTVRSFWLGQTEVTNAMFRCFEPKHSSQSKRAFKGIGFHGDRQPVVRITYTEAEEFCRWLSTKTHRNFRLPTEPEWEYACRAGTTTSRYWGDGIDNAVQYECLWTPEDRAWLGPTPWDRILSLELRYDYETFPGKDGFVGTAPVGGFKPNPWGLHDMLGNVAEYCIMARDMKKPSHDFLIGVARGGSWLQLWTNVRCGSRGSVMSKWRSHEIGFRVACSEEPESTDIQKHQTPSSHKQR